MEKMKGKRDGDLRGEEHPGNIGAKAWALVERENWPCRIHYGAEVVVWRNTGMTLTESRETGSH